MLTHRNRLDHSLLSNLSARLTERAQSKKKEKEKPLPEWLIDLVVPPQDDASAFSPPVCVMSTKLDPLAAVSSTHIRGEGLKPGHLTRQAFYKLAYDQPLVEVLRHKQFVEFPTIEIWEDGAFNGTIVDDHGALVRGDVDSEEDDGWRRRKRRKLSKVEGKKALGGLLGGYGSESDEEESNEVKEENNVFKMLSGYAGSDDEEAAINDIVKPVAETQYDYELGDDDAEGETDDGEDDFEFEDEVDGGPDAEKDPEAVARLLEQLRQAGALRDPGSGSQLTELDGENEDQVDWGDSAEED